MDLFLPDLELPQLKLAISDDEPNVQNMFIEEENPF